MSIRGGTIRPTILVWACVGAEPPKSVVFTTTALLRCEAGFRELTWDDLRGQVPNTSVLQLPTNRFCRHADRLLRMWSAG